ncbi:group 1 glycosyl transferase [[Clostridium] sordellii]|uniref:glycosyltransferase n=1 Tax=Paraclostridium sordellii TaxID=1505 RepID=UPI0005E8AA1C|nr:glycosyltransferase [Paeniclostridium sordellii]CEN76503.1 group 1 glycosyl transferase [[Clostridium] sordellii] [Paeniclostridium sordellii]
MKILQINAVNTWGSTGRTTSEIDLYFRNEGHESIIAYSEGPKIKNGYKIGNSIEKKMHAILSRIFGKQGYFSVIGTKNLINYIKKESPDIIRLGNIHSNYLNIPMLLKFISSNDIPTIITLDDCYFFTGKCTHYTVDNCYKWKTGCSKCPRIYKDNPSWFLDRTKKMWEDKRYFYNLIPRLGVVGVSKWITAEANQSILSSAKYIRTIYNWIDIDLFKPTETIKIKKELNINNKFIILGVSSQWNESKGINCFIELSNMLEDDECIVLVGTINEHIILNENIINIPQTNSLDELVKYYSMADVFLQLSNEESFGKVSAEALACGTPIIAFNSTANSELVGEHCGYLIESNNVSDLNKHIKIIRNNRKEYYSHRCREFAIKNFDKKERISDYIELCKDLINYEGDI